MVDGDDRDALRGRGADRHVPGLRPSSWAGDRVSGPTVPNKQVLGRLARVNLDLAGRVALVTGGVRGVGLGISRVLADAGATVIACARRPGEVDLPGVGFRSCDVRDASAVQTLIDG